MKVQEVILRSMSGRIKWFQTAEIIGDSNDGGRCRSNPSSFVAVRRTAQKSTVLGASLAVVRVDLPAGGMWSRSLGRETIRRNSMARLAAELGSLATAGPWVPRQMWK